MYHDAMNYEPVARSMNKRSTAEIKRGETFIIYEIVRVGEICFEELMSKKMELIYKRLNIYI